MAYERRDFAGGAASTTLSSGITDADTAISIASASGWPAGSNGKFYARIYVPGTATEEKVLVTTRSGTTLQNVTRGVDGTSAASWSSGATIEHVATAVDADEANYWVAELAGAADTAGDLLVADGNNSLDTLAKGSNSQVLAVDSGGTLGYTTVTSAMLADGTIVNADVSASAAIALTKLATITDDRILGNNTGGASTPVALTAAEVKTLLAILSTDLSDFAEAVSDQVGSMVTGNTETGMTVTYQDADNTLDFAVGVDDSTVEINSGNIRVKDLGITTAKLAAANVTAAKLEAGTVKLSSSNTPTVTTTTTGTTAKTIATVTITDPGYNIWVEGHATVACYTETQAAAWAVWSLLITVDGTIVDRLDIPFSIALQGYAGISLGIPLRRTLKSTGSNTVVRAQLKRQVGDGELQIGGDGTTNHLQVYYGRQ